MARMRGLTAVLVLALVGAVSCSSENPTRGTASNQTTADPGTSPATKPPQARPSDTESEPQTPANPAPDFSVESFDGQTFSLAEQRGTPVVLNFWESW